jgi:hypothetical protein
MALLTTVALSLGVGCLNLTYGIGQSSAITGEHAIVSGYLSLLSGSVTAVNRGLERPNKVEQHNRFVSRYGDVCGISTRYAR